MNKYHTLFQAIPICLFTDIKRCFNARQTCNQKLFQVAIETPPAPPSPPDITCADASPASRATATLASPIVRWLARTGESVSSLGNALAPLVTRSIIVANVIIILIFITRALTVKKTSTSVSWVLPCISAATTLNV